jgi:hypothetical protein
MNRQNRTQPVKVGDTVAYSKAFPGRLPSPIYWEFLSGSNPDF